MSVNTMDINDVYQVLNDLHEQATGQKAIAPTDTASFVSMANTTLQAGTDVVFNALMQMVSRTIFSVRPYSRKFGGLERSAEEWGAIVRKISIADTPAEQDEAFFGDALVDGQSVDHYKIKKSNILEMRYYGSNAYQNRYTVYEDQIKAAFTSPAQLGSFLTLQTQNASDKWEQWLEELTRGLLANTIGAKIQLNNGVIHLLTEYNAATELSLTAKTVYQPDNFAPFMRWVYARVKTIARLMSNRSNLFQVEITGKPIMRHTDARDLKMYMTSSAMDQMETQVMATTFNDNYLQLADREYVDYWQNIESPTGISVTPSWINAAGAVQTAESAVTANNIFGVLFDRDAMAYNHYLDRTAVTPLNAAGLYYNVFQHSRVQFMSDLTEKAVVLLLD